MKVAVCIYSTLIHGMEISFGSFTRFQVLKGQFAIAFQGNPFDVMLFFHGMGNGSNVDFQVSINILERRYVFFLCRIDRASDEVSQFLTIIDTAVRDLSSRKY